MQSGLNRGFSEHVVLDTILKSTLDNIQILRFLEWTPCNEHSFSAHNEMALIVDVGRRIMVDSQTLTNATIFFSRIHAKISSGFSSSLRSISFFPLILFCFLICCINFFFLRIRSRIIVLTAHVAARSGQQAR